VIERDTGCPHDGALRAWLDGEAALVPPDTAAHLADCGPCRRRLEALRRVRDDVGRLLAAEPDEIDVDAAWARFLAAAPAAESTDHRHDPAGRRRMTMPKIRSRRSRVAATLVAACAILALFTLAPVRSAAAQFLAIFRVREIRTVPFDPSRPEELIQSGFDPEEFVEVEVVSGGGGLEESRPLSGLSEAEAEVGFALRVPARLGEPVAVELVPAQTVRLHVDGARVHELLDGLGLDASAVPPEDGVVQVRTWDGVAMGFERGERNVVYLTAPSPEVTLPPGWDPAALGRLYLTMLGASPGEAESLAASIDWTSTLVLPVPAGQAETRHVQVDGVEGVLFLDSGDGPRGKDDAAGPGPKGDERDGRAVPAEQAGEERHPGFGPSPAFDFDPTGHMLVWQKDGVLHALGGPIGAEQLVALANDLR
jgi:hypothetical protein